MERSKTRLLMRDITSIEEVGRKVTSELLNQTTPTSFGFIGSRNRTTATQPRQQPTPPLFTITTYHATITPLWYMLSFFFPCVQFFMFHICMSSFLLFGLHGSPIQPLWLRSILIGCSTRLVFSKKCPYWMVLMPVYVETAEGLVKPLVILPATVMPLPSFILIFSRHHRPLCSDRFIHSHNPLHPALHYKSFPHLLSPLFLHRFIDLLRLGTFPIYGRTM